ncbi:MAG: rhodanese-like domain-containing protein [bacterium]|nr:rhodanese-like domain-containing protein [bacterium]
MKSREDLLNEARKEIPEMTVQEIDDYLGKGKQPLLLDVRGQDEWDLGHLKGAVHIPRGRLETDAEARLPEKSREVVVYCAGGVRSLLAAKSLKELGYERVISMSGGYEDWADANLPTEQPPAPEEEAGPSDPGLLEEEIEHLEMVLAKRKTQLERVKQEK